MGWRVGNFWDSVGFVAGITPSQECRALSLVLYAQRWAGATYSLLLLLRFKFGWTEKLRRPVWYRLSPRRLSRAAWGKGYATEAATAALADGFDRCGFERVIATVQPENLASAGVAQKLGMCQLKASGRHRISEEAGQSCAQETKLLVFGVTKKEWAGVAARL